MTTTGAMETDVRPDPAESAACRAVVDDYGLSQAQLARAIGCNRATVSRMLSGEYAVAARLIRHLWMVTRDPRLGELLYGAGLALVPIEPCEPTGDDQHEADLLRLVIDRAADAIQRARRHEDDDPRDVHAFDRRRRFRGVLVRLARTALRTAQVLDDQDRELADRFPRPDPPPAWLPRAGCRVPGARRPAPRAAERPALEVTA